MGTVQKIDNNAPVLYTVDDIIKIFRIGRTKAYELLRSDGFPSFRLNKKLYVAQDKLNEWIRAQSGKSFQF